MKHVFERGLPWLLLALIALQGACKSGGDGPEVGSDTNWLQACDTDDDCGGALCRCGLCTLGCADLAACGAIEQAQLCVETSELSATSCRLGFAEPAASGICTRACSSHADCGPNGGSAAYCFEGVCLPGVAATPRGSIASVATRGADAAADEGGADAASGAGGSSAAAGSGAAGEGGQGGEGGADAGSAGAGETDAGDAAVGDGGVVLTGEGQLGGGMPLFFPDGGQAPFEVLYPQPTCPCQSDLPDGVAAPAPGEAPANPYGNPQPPAAPSSSPLEGGESWLQCFAFGGDNAFSWFVADTACVHYDNCFHECRSDADCPAGGSGTAHARCSTTGYCFLDCREDRTCPDGMSCVTGVDGAGCYWARDVLHPDCPAYCRQRPPPRECENWCADLLVACNPDAGVNCCAGLTCTEGGYCDDAP